MHKEETNDVTYKEQKVKLIIAIQLVRPSHW